ncbi:hypothetical protein B0I37DRAFT_440426 [Chaetomium sp. MPI-CAGE-AT-0009]|nr:hypothetical protein B0I37DRAFT_440426 [Chaetomium sp. MPI-CAGE-AT-0009]
MLYGPFREGFSQQTGDDWTVSLPEDDADALRVILSVLHSKFDTLPETASLDSDFVFRLVVLSDKYDTVASLKPFWKNGMRLPDSPYDSNLEYITPHDLAQHFWASYTLGDGYAVSRALCALVNRTSLGGDKRPRIKAMNWFPETDHCDLDSNEYLCSIGTDIIERVKQARLRLLEGMCTNIQDVMESLLPSSDTSTLCRAREGAVACDRALLGALHKAMQYAGIGNRYRSRMKDFAKTLPLSVLEMHEMLKKIRTHADHALEKGDRHARSAHANCRIGRHIQDLRFDRMDEHDILVSHDVDHIKKQAEKSGLDPALRVSPRWNDLLYGPSSDYKDLEGVNGWVIHLPKVYPDILRIILQVAHGQFSDIPAVLPRGVLFHLTALCHKYDMAGLLKPFWAGWVGKLPRPTLSPATFVQQIWIADRLGHLDGYMGILLELLYSAQKHPDGRLFLENDPNIDFYDNYYLKKLGFLKRWENGRLRMLKAASNALRAALDKLLDPATTNCCSYKSQDWQQTCDCAMLGAVYRALHGKDWYSGGVQDWEQNLEISVRQLVTKIEEIRIAAVGDSRVEEKQGGAHRACTPWTPIRLSDIVRMPVSQIGDVRRNDAYFEERAKISGLDVLAAPVSAEGTVPPAQPLSKPSG